MKRMNNFVEFDRMKPLWIVLGIILWIAAIYLGITYYEDNWLVLLPMGTLISIGSMLLFFGATLGGRPKPQAAPQQMTTPVAVTQPTSNVKARRYSPLPLRRHRPTLPSN